MPVHHALMKPFDPIPVSLNAGPQYPDRKVENKPVSSRVPHNPEKFKKSIPGIGAVFSPRFNRAPPDVILPEGQCTVPAVHDS